MKKAVTLKKNHEFRRLYNKGNSAPGNGMVIYCKKNRLGRNRLGITVSTKLGGAVVRNRIRRRLREVFRLNDDKLRQGWDMILVGRSRAIDLPWKELNQSFLRICKKLGILASEPPLGPALPRQNKTGGKKI
jgi:ribonuclease P protein component